MQTNRSDELYYYLKKHDIEYYKIQPYPSDNFPIFKFTLDSSQNPPIIYTNTDLDLEFYKHLLQPLQLAPSRWRSIYTVKYELEQHLNVPVCIIENVNKHYPSIPFKLPCKLNLNTNLGSIFMSEHFHYHIEIGPIDYNDWLRIKERIDFDAIVLIHSHTFPYFKIGSSKLSDYL